MEGRAEGNFSRSCNRCRMQSHRGLWVRKERIIWVWKTAAAAACCVTELFQYSLRLAMMGPEAGAALTFQYVFPVCVWMYSHLR
ncbi:hypothetical protein EDD16DRAFT_1561192 [Pisolithus croceorrhizus]|nr:hypothetical protein EDD16DRAFT_1561192 [Pisolithus croceorrhizus]